MAPATLSALHRVSHIYKTFDHPVLVDVSFDVNPGETVAIIGRSGVGKIGGSLPYHGFLKPDQAA